MGDPASMMIKVMVEGITKQIRSGALPEALADANKYIPSIENQDEKVLYTFGSTLAVLYLLRGLCKRALGFKEAEDDLQKSLVTMAKHGTTADQAAMADLVKRIQAMNMTGQAMITEFLDEFNQLKLQKGQGSPSQIQAGRAVPHITRWAIGALLGGLLWIVAVLIFYRLGMHGGSGTLVRILTVIPLYLLIDSGLKGWSWHSQYAYNTVGALIKTFVFLILGISVIGTLPVFYWTGKGVLETFKLWKAED